MALAPVYFLSHGAPTIVLDPCPARTFLCALGSETPRPAAVAVVSAHHEARRVQVTGSGAPPTIHDFRGFPAELYEMQYPAPGAPALASQIVELIEGIGVAAALDEHRGFDHGAWTPLSLMYPSADIPVVQVSLLRDASPAAHMAVGEALAPLRSEGVMIVASGALTHNLAALRGGPIDAPTPDWVERFRNAVFEAVSCDDRDALLTFERFPEARRNHPTDEHFMPFFVALGASGQSVGRRIHTSTTYGVLAMDAYAWR